MDTQRATQYLRQALERLAALQGVLARVKDPGVYAGELAPLLRSLEANLVSAQAELEPTPAPPPA